MSKSNGNGHEPLSNYQDLSLTGRMDPESNGSHGASGGKPTRIQSVKVVKGLKNEFLEIEFSREERDETTGGGSYYNRKRPPHPDFTKALAGLRVHWGLLTTFLDAGKKKSVDGFDDKELENFTVTGISMGNDPDEPRVTITGYKTRKDGRAVIANAPYQLFESEEDVPDYGFNRFLENLQTRVAKVMEETRLYIGGKRLVVQTEMEMEPTS